jgi:peroxin-6
LAQDVVAPNTPATALILFFDELDNVAPRWGGIVDGGSVMEWAVETLFAKLDGVFVMGTTNRPDLLDPSLLCPGCLDRLVYLGLPTDNGQEQASMLTGQLHKLQLEGREF